MELSICRICKEMSRISLLFAVIMASLALQNTCVSSKFLPEEPCKLRPAIVAVKQEGFEPHHIKLHRCQGTCGNKLPSQAPCVAASKHEISLDLKDLTTNKPAKVTVFNHTSCGCYCQDCKDGEYADEHCRCIILPNPQGKQDKNEKGNPDKNEKVNLLPYQIGLVAIGLFALCVLVLDMIMCAKGHGVIYRVKQCCLPAPNRGDAAVSNGKSSEAKETRNGFSSAPEVHHV